MSNVATVDTLPPAEPRVSAPQALTPRHVPGPPLSVGLVVVVEDGVDEVGNPKTCPCFETVGLESGSAPALFDASMEQDSFAVGGSSHVNPGRGINAKAHARGATGVAQCVELFQQLRGARNALAHNIGGPTAVLATTILEGPGANGR
jgi:hypothetical protein